MFLGTVVLRLECAIESWKKLVKNTDAWSPPWHMLNQEVLAGAQVSVSLKCPGGADALWWRSTGLGGGRDCGGCLSSVTIRTSLDCQDFGQPGLMVESRSSAVPLCYFNTICIAYRL